MQLNLKVFQFFGGSSGQVPDVLTERYQAYTYLLLLFVSISIVVLALARSRNNQSFRVIFQSVFKIVGVIVLEGSRIVAPIVSLQPLLSVTVA